MSGSFRTTALFGALILMPTYAFVGANDASPHDGRRSLTTWDSVFSAEQATRGQLFYAKSCQRCHTATLTGADEAAPLAGGSFMSNWNGQTLLTLHDRIISSMPSDTPGVYKKTDVADVVAYILNFNGFPAGKNALPVADDSLKAIAFTSTKP